MKKESKRIAKPSPSNRSKGFSKAKAIKKKTKFSKTNLEKLCFIKKGQSCSLCMCHGIVCHGPSCSSFGIAVLENNVYTFGKQGSLFLERGLMQYILEKDTCMFLDSGTVQCSWARRLKRICSWKRGMRKMCFWKRTYSSLTFMGLLFHCFLCSFPKLEVIYTKDFKVFDMNLLNNLRKI